MTGQLISVYSSRGGVGKTFIAANLAVNLHLDTKQSLLLVDFGRPFCHGISYILGLKGVKRLDTLLAMADKLKPPMIKGYATQHASGIHVLALSDGLRKLDGTLLNSETLRAVMDCLKSNYTYIVVDAGSSFDVIGETLFDESSAIVIPTAADFLSLQHTVNDLKLFQSRNFPREMLHVVANRLDKNAMASSDMLCRTLSVTSIIPIPLDPSMETAMGQGTYPEKSPRHPVTKALDHLGYTLVRAIRQGRKPGGASVDKHYRQDRDIDALKRRIHEKLLEEIDFKKLDTEVESDPEKLAELHNTVSRKISEIIDTDFPIRERSLREEVVKAVLQESLGLGPLEDILNDTGVSEIMVNTWDEIYVERKGKLTRIDKKFFSEQHLINIISRITAPLGRKIDTSTPMVDARLKDGSRVNAIIPPLAVRGACLTIRKFPEDQIGIEDLLGFGTLNRQMVDFLKSAVISKLNILISGGTGSGKTTLLNILSSFIPEDERIITIEDSAELKLRQPHVVTLESRPENIEGKGEVTIRDLVKNSLRMRPDRIVVGECRGAESLDMLQAMNTGHDGSLTTVHSNTCREALSRLETLVMYAGLELPAKAIKEQIIGAVDLIIQISRFKDGSRKVIQVAEVGALEGDTISLGDVFVYKQTGEEEGRVVGNFTSTGYVPKCVEKFAEQGLHVPREVFWTSN